MPNWCSNYVQFSGDLKALQTIKDRLSGDRIRRSSSGWWTEIKEPPYTQEELDRAQDENSPTLMCGDGCSFFGRLLSYKDLKETCTQAEYGYDESIANIGTKWDPHYYITEVEEGMLALTLESAWSPPERGVALVARKYGVSAEMVYEESGCDFGGMLVYDAKTDTVRDGSTGYYQFRILEEWGEISEKNRQDVVDYMLNHFDVEELDDELLELVETIIKENQGLRSAEDILGEPVPAEEWIGESQSDGKASMAAIKAQVAAALTPQEKK